MKILSVEAKDFRAYPELNWRLPEAGLYMIDAVTDTGRSNMAGKTTLLDSIFWGLFGWLPKWEGPKGGPVDAVIRRGAAKCQVKVTLENDGHVITVNRQRPNKLQLFQDGEEIHGKSSDLDKRIEQLIGMTASQFLLSVYIAQDRGSSFFTMTDGERTQLLSVIAGLEELEKGLAEAKQRKEKAQAALDKAEGALSILQEQHNAIPGQKTHYQSEVSARRLEIVDIGASFASLSKEASQKEAVSVEKWNSTLLRMQNERDTRSSDIHSERDEYVERAERLRGVLGQHSGVEPRYYAAIDQIKAKLSEIEAYNKEQERIRLRNYQRIEKINKALDEAESAGQGRCSSCNQDLPQSEREKHAQKFLNQAHKIQSEIEPEGDLMSDVEFKTLLERATQDLANRKAELDAKPNQIKQELAAVNASIEAFDARLAQVESEFEAKKAKAEAEHQQELVSISQKIKDAEAELKNKKVVLDHAVKSLKTIEDQEEEVRSKLEEVRSKAAELTEELNEALDLIELFGPKGFRSVCFDGIIERISQRAGQLFSIMTEGVYSTSLVQIGEDSKGASKLILRPVITKGGQEVPMDDLSGGARRMAMLAYDVAVSETTAGSAPLLLDEALDGLDVVGKGEALRLLESVSQVRPVFVIDHSSEFKSSFNQVLTVVHRNGESSLGERS